MSIAEQIRLASKTALEKLYGLAIDGKEIQINETKPEFEGDYTLVLFSFIKQLKNHPSNLVKKLVMSLPGIIPTFFLLIM